MSNLIQLQERKDEAIDEKLVPLYKEYADLVFKLKECTTEIVRLEGQLSTEEMRYRKIFRDRIWLK